MKLYKKGDIIIFCTAKLTVTRDQTDHTIRCKDSDGRQTVLFQPFIKVKKKKAKKKKAKKKRQLTVS